MDSGHAVADAARGTGGTATRVAVTTIARGAPPGLSVVGDLDVDAAETLWTAIETTGTRHRSLVLDLSETTSVDSVGLQLLVRAQRVLGGRPDAVVLRRPSPPVLRALQAGGLLAAFAIASDTASPTG